MPLRFADGGERSLFRRGDGFGGFWGWRLVVGRGQGGCGVGQVAIAHPRSGVETSPRVARRARLVAAARRLKSASTLGRPLTRALRPPWVRRIIWPSLRSTLGRVAR